MRPGDLVKARMEVLRRERMRRARDEAVRLADKAKRTLEGQREANRKMPWRPWFSAENDVTNQIANRLKEGHEMRRLNRVLIRNGGSSVYKDDTHNAWDNVVRCYEENR